MGASIECRDMYHHFEDSPMALVYGSDADMIRLNCNYTLTADEVGDIAMATWSLNDVIQASIEIGVNDTEFEDDWSEASGHAWYDEDAMWGMSMVTVPTHTLQDAHITFDLTNANMTASFDNSTMNFSQYSVL